MHGFASTLVEEYKEKNDTLTRIVTEYKSAADEKITLTNTVNDLKQVNDQQQHRIDELKRELQLQTDMSKFELENLGKRLLLEKDAALLEMKLTLQAKQEEQQAKYTAAVSEYENKVRDLLNLLEQRNLTEPVKPSRAKKTPAQTD
jgi:hypothetical protein